MTPRHFLGIRSWIQFIDISHESANVYVAQPCRDASRRAAQEPLNLEVNSRHSISVRLSRASQSRTMAEKNDAAARRSGYCAPEIGTNRAVYGKKRKGRRILNCRRSKVLENRSIFVSKMKSLNGQFRRGGGREDWRRRRRLKATICWDLFLTNVPVLNKLAAIDCLHPRICRYVPDSPSFLLIGSDWGKESDDCSNLGIWSV